MSGYRRHLLILTMLIILTLPMFVDASISETETTLTSLEFELTSGNSIDWDRTPIVSTDVTGVLQLDPKKDGYADVHVIFQDGKNLATVEASNTPLTKEVTTCSDKSQSIRIGVTDTTNNVFLSLLVLENGSLYISVATVISSVRYSGTTLIQSSSITESDWDIILSNYQTKTETFVDLESLPEDFDRSFKGKSTVRATTLASGEGGRSKSGDKIYYLAYYDIGLDKYREGYPEYLNTTVLENSFCTDFISRSNPSVVDIKGDLAAYCDNENNNYLGVYHLAFHGSFNDDDPDDPYVNIHLGGTQNILHCGDISEMWDEPDVTPKGGIVVSWCCNSLRDKLWDEENPGETDNFCEAFLELEYNGEDYGAKAYIGGENTIAGPVALQNPKRRDRGTPMLFECLARSDMSVNDSVQFVNERGLVDNDCLHFRIQEDISSPVYLRNDDSTEPVFPDDWRFYKTHIIEKTSGAGEDYQVHIRVDYGSGSDGGVIVYMQNGDGVPHCQVDFDDIRFQWKNSSDEWEMLDHWKYYVEVSGGGHYADFWVEISGDLDEDDQQIRIYYGDTGANAAEETSNASATFPLYDDFSGNSVNSNIWRVHSGTNSSVSDGLLQITGSEDGDVLTSKWSDSGDDYVYKIRAKMVTDVTNGKWCGFWLRDQFFDTYNYSKGYVFQLSEGWEYSYLKKSTGTVLSMLDYGDQIQDNTWTQIKLRTNGDEIEDKCGLELYATDNTYSSGSFGIGKGEDAELLVDWVLVRKYLALPPLHGSWGPEYPFMDGWLHRKAHVVKGVPGAGEDYAVQFIVHRYPNAPVYNYVDNGAHVYIGEDITTDFDDIRFLSEESHLTMKPQFLKHWRGAIWTEGSATTPVHLCAEFWVQFDESLDYDQTVYIYYGNRLATSDNQPDSMFEFFDDFLVEDLDGQWTFEAGSYSIEDGVLEMEDNTTKIYSDDTFMPGVSYHARVYFDDYRSSGFVQQQYGSDRFDSDLATWATQPSAQVDVEDNGNEDIVQVTQSTTEWLSHSINWYSDEYAESFINGVSKSTHDTYVPDGSSDFGTGIPIYLKTYIGDANPLLKVDYIFVRNCVYPEPSHGVWGSEVDLDTSPGTWKYRQSHKLIGNTSVGTDYQVKFIAHTGNGSSSGNNVYLNNHGESDFSDVRFTNDDATELLDYWCEYQDASSAEFWAEVSDDLSSNQTIYIYYGFDGAVSSSDGYATFDWFEDFEDEAIDTNPDSTRWEDPVDDDGGGTYVDVVSDPDQNEDDQALKIYNNGDQENTYIRSKSMGLGQRGYAMGWKWYRADDQYSYFFIYGTSGYLVYTYSGTSHEYFKFRDKDAVWQNPSPSWRENQWDSWRRLEFRVTGVNQTTGMWRDVSDNTNHTIHLRNEYPMDSGYLDKITPIFSNRYRTQTLYTDDIYVRKYIETEPGHGDWGAEVVLT